MKEINDWWFLAANLLFHGRLTDHELETEKKQSWARGQAA